MVAIETSGDWLLVATRVMAKTKKTAARSPTKELTLAQALKCRLVRRETMNNVEHSLAVGRTEVSGFNLAVYAAEIP